MERQPKVDWKNQASGVGRLLIVSFSQLDYCQYRLSSPINFTGTHLAEHLEGVSHDRIKRYLQGEKLTPRPLWENVRSLVVGCEEAYLVFDDTVIDQRHASRWNWCGGSTAGMNTESFEALA